MNAREAGGQLNFGPPLTEEAAHRGARDRAVDIRAVAQPLTGDIYRSLFEHNIDGMYQMDLDGIFRAANPACERLSGHPLSELVGSSWRRVIPLREREVFMHNFLRATMGETQDFRTQLVHRNGHRVDASIRSIPVYVEGKVVGVYGIVHDLTERKKAEEAQRVSEGRFRAIFECTAIGVSLVDISGRILDVNGAFIDIVGRASDDLVGLRMVDVIHSDDRAANWKLFQEMIDGDRTHYHLETRCLRKDEQAVWANLTTSIVKNADGIPQFCIAIVEDITERKLLEEELRGFQKMEAVGRLAGGIAHDFNNHLAVIQNYANFLSEAFDETDRHHHDANEIITAVERAAALVRQLLTFSRRQEVNPQVLQLNNVVVEMEKLLSRTIGEDIQLHTRLDPDLWMTVIDPGGVEQIIANLAVNARDAMPDGGSVTIETINVEVDDDFSRRHAGLHAGRYVCLAIRDTGVGMTEEVAAQVFDPFFTTKPCDQGSGLGLSTVYGIVEQAGGHIFVYSEPGAGTSFEAYLPVADEAAALLRTVDTRTEMNGRGRVVLLAEDEPSVRAVVRRMLERNGYVVIGGSPDEARDISMRPGLRIDVLLTDVVMPQLSGAELATAVLKNHGDCPVVFMSGYSEDVLARHPIERPGAKFVAKPFTEKELIGTLRTVLDAQ